MDTEIKKEKTIKEIFGLLDQIDPDGVSLDNITIRAGGKILKFDLVSEQEIPIEDETRNEFKEKIHQKVELIRDQVNKKITEMSEWVNGIKSEYDRKEQMMKEKQQNMVAMPDVSFIHAQKGLSVVKSSISRRTANSLTWLVRGVYWPKTVDSKKIEPRFSKKLLTPVIFLVQTEGNNVVGCSTRKVVNLDYFEHYHQSHPDCWGNWNFSRKWSKPEDIIKVAREAEAVLENINTKSIAHDNPSGLPRKSTLLKHILDEKETDEKKLRMGILNQQVRRAGISPDIREDDTSVWST